MTARFSCPLDWPDGEAISFNPRRSRFGPHTLGSAILFVEEEMRRLGATEVVMSADWSIGRSGRPLADTREGSPVVVRYKVGEDRLVFAQCEYDNLIDNLWSIGLVIEGIRSIARHGGDAVARRVSTGFMALPEPPKAWYQILGVDKDEDPLVVAAKWKVLAKRHHPDVGGDPDAMAEINKAYDEFKLINSKRQP